MMAKNTQTKAATTSHWRISAQNSLNWARAVSCVLCETGFISSIHLESRSQVNRKNFYFSPPPHGHSLHPFRIMAAIASHFRCFMLPSHLFSFRSAVRTRRTVAGATAQITSAQSLSPAIIRAKSLSCITLAYRPSQVVQATFVIVSTNSGALEQIIHQSQSIGNEQWTILYG